MVAYATDSQIVKFGAGDVLVTDASDSAIKAGQTSVDVLTQAVRNGADVYSVPNLHAKVYVFDSVAVIGSANLSNSSMNDLIEAAWVTDQPAAVSGAHGLIDGLVSVATVIDGKFLDRASKLPVTKSRHHRRGQPQKPQLERKHRVWLVGIGPISRDFPDEADTVERGTGIAREQFRDESNEAFWIRYSGDSRFRKEAAVGDSVILIWSGGESGAFPTGVYRHAPILSREDIDDGKSSYFFLEESEQWNETGLLWTKFKRLAKNVGVPFKMTQWMCRELSGDYSAAIHELWERQ